MVSAAELFQKAQKQSVRVGFDEWLSTLPVADREAFHANADNTAFSHRTFMEVAKQLGCPNGRETITAWRKANGFGR